MTELADMVLLPYEGAESLSEDQVEELLGRLPGCRVTEREGVRRPEKSFPFPDLGQAMALAVRVGEMAEAAGHHPALLTMWRQTAVSWWAHRVGRPHTNDLIMAARTERLYADLAHTEETK